MAFIKICLAVLLTIFHTPVARHMRANGHNLMLEVQSSLGFQRSQAIQARLAHMEEVLGHTFNALPRNSRGAIGSSAATYALHRLFLQLHGWQMKDLQPGSSSGSDRRSPTMTLALGASHAQQRLRDAFEEQLTKHGLDLHSLAMLAATIENLVQSKAEQLLNASFQAAGIFAPPSPGLSSEDALKVMELYMAGYVLGVDRTGPSLANELQRLLDEEVRTYPRWEEVRWMLLDATKEKLTYDVKMMSSILQVTERKFFGMEEQACQSLQDQLQSMEDRPGSGRVLLKDFYGPALLSGQFEFTESVSFLRQAGVLDESDTASPRVMIPNYLMADSNCLGRSDYFAVCCSDQCEDFMDRLEALLQAPSAPPERLLELVSGFPEATNMTFSGELTRRLSQVAEHHGGEVPLHGRLFAQWMHHTFPRTCPFPHVAGTTTRESFLAFQEKQDSYANFEEMKDHLKAGQWSKPLLTETSDFGMWSEVEELVDPEGHKNFKPRREDWETLSWSTCCLLATLVGFSATLPRKDISGRSSFKDKKIV